MLETDVIYIHELRGSQNSILVLNGHVPTDNRGDYTKDSFQVEWIHFAHCKVKWQALVNMLHETFRLHKTQGTCLNDIPKNYTPCS